MMVEEGIVRRLMEQFNSGSGARFLAIFVLILGAAALRLIPHPPNFSPIAAMALFGGTMFSSWSRDARQIKPSLLFSVLQPFGVPVLAFAIPLVAMLLSDWVLGFHDQMVVVYGSFVLITALGVTMKNSRRLVPIGLATASGSLLFFTLTNLAVWWTSGMYQHSTLGLEACFVAALPFLQNGLAGDLIFATVLFGSWSILEKKVSIFVLESIKS
jgi:hypothetical protein